MAGSGPAIAGIKGPLPPPKPQFPWFSGNARQGETADAPGWTAWHSELPANTTVTMGFVHGASMQLFGTITFMLTAAFGCWKLLGRPVCSICLLGAFGVAAVTLPDAYVPIASDGVLGALFCLLIRWTGPKALVSASAVSPPAHGDATSHSHLAISATGRRLAMLVAMLTILFHCGPVRGEGPPNGADSSPEERTSHSPPLYKVFVPIDASQKPTGERYTCPNRSTRNCIAARRRWPRSRTDG